MKNILPLVIALMAQAPGWVVISMKNDWGTIYPAQPGATE